MRADRRAQNPSSSKGMYQQDHFFLVNMSDVSARATLLG
jgi:hypothetical protein